MNIDFSNEESIAEFIMNTETGIHDGKNVEGQRIIIYLEQGIGMKYETIQSNGWRRISEYNASGQQVGVYYQREDV